MKACLASSSRTVLIPRVLSASSQLARMKGLLGCSDLAEGEALHIFPCGSIHTVGMKFSLDLIFLDSKYTVCRIVRNVLPWRMVLGGWTARSVLEFKSGWIKDSMPSKGDVLVFEEVSD